MSHGMLNERRIFLVWLYKLIPGAYHLFRKSPEYLRLLKAEELRMQFSSEVSDEIQLAAHPVGEYKQNLRKVYLISLPREYNI